MEINNTKLTKNLKSDSFSKNAYYIDDTLYFSNGHFIITASAGTIENLKTGFDNDTKTARLLKDSYNNMCECFKDSCARCCVSLQDLKAVKAAGRNDFLIPTNNEKFAAFSTNYLLDFFEMLKIKSDHIVNISKNGKMLAIFYEGVTVILLGVNLPKEKQNNNSYFLDFCTDKENGYKLLEEKEKKKQEARQAAKTATDKPKKLEMDKTITGFYYYRGNIELFMQTDKTKITKSIIKTFIKRYCIVKGLKDFSENEDAQKEFKYFIERATLTLKSDSKNKPMYFDIKTNNGVFGDMYKESLSRLYIFDDKLNNISFIQNETETAETETAPPKTATIQETATTDTDNATTTETANDNSVTTDNSRKKVLHGFYMTFKNRDIFVATNEEAKRRYIVQAFINEMINISNHLQNITEEKRNNILNDKEILNETKKRITPATIQEIWTHKENHIRITSDNSNMIVNHSLNNFKTIIIDRFGANEEITPTQETAFKFFSGISKLNNQLTENITQDIKTDLQADNRQTETETAPTTATTTTETTTTATTIKTADKPKKVISLFVAVTSQELQPLKFDNLPKIEKYPTYASYFYRAIVEPVKVSTKTGAGVGSCGSRAGVQGLGSKAETITSGFLQPFNTS